MYWAPPSPINHDNPPIRLALFDIDGTLLHASRIHIQAFGHAMEKYFGVKTLMSWPNFQGRTDPWIVQELARLNGIPENEILPKVPQAVICIADYYEQHATEERGKTLPGVNEFLAEIDRRGILRGLVTGNPEKLAFLKLKHFCLHTGFALGGFGSDHIERSHLITMAIERAEQQYGYKGGSANAIYIADTPFDIQSAHDAGIRAVAVRTNVNKNLDFQGVKPELILDNLTFQAEFFQVYLS